MAVVTLKTLQAQLNTKCRSPEITAKDVFKVISYYPDLRPTMAQYVFPDGSSRELMNLSGTIPITYRGASYNIPVEIWIMDSHPYNPPLCYVKPTADMKIKHNRHVDQNGRVYLPYLTDWNHNSSDLLECCQIMALMFGEEPPVYSKKPSSSGGQASQVSPTYNSGGGSPVNAYGTMPMPYPPQPSNPVYPAYPPVGGAYSQQQPAYPAYPPVRGNEPSYPPLNPSNRNSYPAYNQPPGNNPYPAAVSPPNYSVFPLTDKSPGRTGTITDEHIRASLLSGVEEKLGRRLNEIVAQAQDEITSLTKTHDELERGRRNLDEIFERLEKEQRAVDRNIAVLTEKTAELRTAIEKSSTQESFDVDEAVVPTAPLYKQLLTAYAEESALEDAMYYIGEALRRNVIDLDVFLKHTRELSRKQFMQRALIQKCRDKAGLP